MSDKIEELLQQSKKLEENVIASLADSNSDVEIILKELLVYLNATSHGLGQIHSIVESIKEPMFKIDTIASTVLETKNTILDYPREFQKAIDEQSRETAVQLKDVIDPLKSYVSKLTEYIKSIGSGLRNQMKKVESNEKNIERVGNEVNQLSKDLENAKNEILKNQEGLYKVIDSILKNKSEGLRTTASVESKKIQSETDIQKQKREFWLKIIGYVIGSGGLIYFIFDTLFNSGAG